MKTIKENLNFIQDVLKDNQVDYFIPKMTMGYADDEDLFSIEIVVLNYHHEVAAILDVRVEDHIHVFRRKLIDEYCGESFLKTLFKIEGVLNAIGDKEDE